MRLRFDAHQPHQLAAVQAVVDLFAHQGSSARYARLHDVALDGARLLAQTRAVQERHGLPASASLGDAQFSLEMETGTGKTYAYLRTLHELHLRYGVSRAIIVVPGVAIREGVLQQIRATADHFATRYEGRRIQARIFRPDTPSHVRRFARDDGIQVLILNMDAFNKGRSNLIHRPADALGGRSPMDLVAATRPLVILDEPQNMEGPRTREAIGALGALAVLRYSATHRHLHHLLYRLDPVRAYDLGLVKRIEVASVIQEGEPSAPLEVKLIAPTRSGVSARIVIEASDGRGTRQKTITVRRQGEDLYDLSGGREIYRGYEVDHIDAERGVVAFQNGVEVSADPGAAFQARSLVMGRQIEETVEEHLEKQLKIHRLQPAGRRLKVLSLFFVDRVAHYAETQGPIRLWFVEAYERLAAKPRYACLHLPEVERVHAGYFARRRGQAVDTGGRSRDDDEAYELIMRHKERLLSLDEPVSFLFSHSALREGWDNPNVFQICTLHPSRSELRKRQEIGRGLRLPVMENGDRCTDPDLARLLVVANESYDDFARRLQTEMAEDCGVDYGDRVSNRRAPRPVELRAGWMEDAAFRTLWREIARSTRIRCHFDDHVLMETARSALAAAAPPRSAGLVVERGEIGRHGPTRTTRLARDQTDLAMPLPDPLDHLQEVTGLTRRTLAAILAAPGWFEGYGAQPIEALHIAVRIISQVLDRALAEGAEYDLEPNAPLPATLWSDRRLEAGSQRVEAVQKSIHVAVPVTGEDEAKWVREQDADPAVQTLLRWPRWLPVETPLGPVDPGWAVLRSGTDGPDVSVTRTAKAGLSPGEARCVAAHFAALGARFEEVYRPS